VFISSLRASGVPQPLSELGETAPTPFDLASSNNHLEVEFFALNHEGGAPLRYQHRLGAQDAGWSLPSELRTVTYAFLSPGAYTFAVRAVRPDGAVSEVPAVVAFTIRPPFYATWWFLGLSALGVAGVVVAGYRVRVARLIGVERVRSRIATDLHDDIGASLSQIAILAEVARARAGATPERPDATDPLARIAETSRTLVDSMSDIVWAINPEVDSLDDLVHRMRRFIEDTLGSADLEVVFAAPDPAHTVRLGADVRREVFLILKESVNNIAKHARCRTATITLAVDRRRLVLEIADDGRGFDPDAPTDGNGVASMRRRIAALGGRLTLETGPDRGTRLRLDLEHPSRHHG
jgi:signal transduction histidine kinase